MKYEHKHYCRELRNKLTASIDMKTIVLELMCPTLVCSQLVDLSVWFLLIYAVEYYSRFDRKLGSVFHRGEFTASIFLEE